MKTLLLLSFSALAAPQAEVMDPGTEVAAVTGGTDPRTELLQPVDTLTRAEPETGSWSGWLLPLGLAAIGASWFAQRQLAKRQTLNQGGDFKVLSRHALSVQNSLAIIEVEDRQGETRRLLVGLGGGAPTLVADLTTSTPAVPASFALPADLAALMSESAPTVATTTATRPETKSNSGSEVPGESRPVPAPERPARKAEVFFPEPRSTASDPRPAISLPNTASPLPPAVSPVASSSPLVVEEKVGKILNFDDLLNTPPPPPAPPAVATIPPPSAPVSVRLENRLEELDTPPADLKGGRSARSAYGKPNPEPVAPLRFPETPTRTPEEPPARPEAIDHRRARARALVEEVLKERQGTQVRAPRNRLEA